MNILQEILASKEREVRDRKERIPIRQLESSVHFSSPTISLKKYLHRIDKVGIIAEIKRRSPSRGIFHRNVSVEELSIGYMQAGASALSVLTDGPYFGGSLEDMRVARRFNFCPILRKDFIIDEYQIVEARSAGADAILLIGSALRAEQAISLARFAHTLQLEILFEIHDEEELKNAPLDEIDFIGVNTRDLKDFSVDPSRAIQIAEKAPKNMELIAESGIQSPADVLRLKAGGYSGFLIGERFMSQVRPEAACRDFVQEIQQGTDTQ